MIKVEKIDVWGFEHAVRGMRNPLNSWNKSDSYYEDKDKFVIGPNDINLMKRLFDAGPEHRKYLRQIIVSMDITAPLYWWKEFDTYKVGTVSNSCSTMHKLSSKEFTFDDFSIEHLDEFALSHFKQTVNVLNAYRDKYNKSKDKSDWWNLVQLLPSSYNQKRTITMNYENVITIIKQRTGHKLDEWNNFVNIISDLPYVKTLI